MARGFEKPPWWAVVVIVVGLVGLVVGLPIALKRGGEPLPKAELDRLAAAASSADAADQTTEALVAAFMGDSYTAGAGAGDQAHRFTSLVAAHESWVEQNFGVGGTGYVTTVEGSSAQKACSLDRCPSYPEVIAQAAAANPSIVIVSGGRNDVPNVDGKYAAGVADFFQQLRAALPDAQIIATSPLWGADVPPSELASIARAVQDGVTAVGGTYLDIGQPLRGHPEWIIADGIHPNAAGHAAIAQAVDAALDSLAIPSAASPSR